MTNPELDFLQYCPVVPEICPGHVHVARKEKRLIIIITLTAIVIYKIYMQFIKNI
jgi:hypothetical protein